MDPQDRTHSPATPDSLQHLLSEARTLAENAGKLTLRHFGDAVTPETKSDGSPVTLADREAESYLRDAIRSRFPDHGVLGEEFGEDSGTAPVRWILDPIDGTRSFMRGVPLYAVLIGIEVEEEAMVGVAHFPALGETVAAAIGIGCFWTRDNQRDRTSSVSRVSELSDAVALTTDTRAASASPIAAGWSALSTRVDFVRSWGDAYGHILVATGRAEIMVDPSLSAWDAAPLLPIVTEAGGQFTDLRGDPTVHGGSGVSTNGRLHARTLALLNEDVT